MITSNIARKVSNNHFDAIVDKCVHRYIKKIETGVRKKVEKGEFTFKISELTLEPLFYTPTEGQREAIAREVIKFFSAEPRNFLIKYSEPETKGEGRYYNYQLWW